MIDDTLTCEVCGKTVVFFKLYTNYTAMDVKKLREQTGADIKSCRNALAVSGDFEKAKEYLRQISLATKRVYTLRCPHCNTLLEIPEIYVIFGKEL